MFVYITLRLDRISKLSMPVYPYPSIHPHIHIAVYSLLYNAKNNIAHTS